MLYVEIGISILPLPFLLNFKIYHLSHRFNWSKIRKIGDLLIDEEIELKREKVYSTRNSGHLSPLSIVELIQCMALGQRPW